jgi:hypothetical protein
MRLATLVKVILIKTIFICRFCNERVVKYRKALEIGKLIIPIPFAKINDNCS